MTFKKHISGFLVLVMLAMQLLLAQHYTVHFNEEAHTVAHHQLPSKGGDGNHQDADPDDICQICLFAKIFSQSTFSLAFVALPLFVAEILKAASIHISPEYNVFYSFSARAPPL